MENDFENKISNIDKVINYIKEKKKIFIISASFIIFLLIGIIYLDYHKNLRNKKISEKFVQAGLYLASENKSESNNLYKEVVLSKNKFYSPLALNNIIDNNLETNNEEIIRLFEILESINLEKERKNLVKLKKALFLLKISKDQEGNKLLNEIISDNSIWKNAAEELL